MVFILKIIYQICRGIDEDRLIQIGQEESGRDPPTFPLRQMKVCAANMLLESWRLHFDSLYEVFLSRYVFLYIYGMHTVLDHMLNPYASQHAC
jgi:hypothetical protein